MKWLAWLGWPITAAAITAILANIAKKNMFRGPLSPKRVKYGFFIWGFRIWLIFMLGTLLFLLTYPTFTLPYIAWLFWTGNAFGMSALLITLAKSAFPKQRHRKLDNLSPYFRIARVAQPIVEAADKGINVADDPDKKLAAVRKNKGVPVDLSGKELNKHIHLLGQTGAGKTKGAITPLMVQAIEKRLPVIVIDPKGDDELLKVAYETLDRQGRIDDLMVVDLVNIDKSVTWNPLIFGTPEEIAARIIGTLPEFKRPEKMATPFFAEKQAEVMKMTTSAFAAIVTLQKLLSGKKQPGLNFIDLYNFTNFMPDSIEFAVKYIRQKRAEYIKRFGSKGIPHEQLVEALNWLNSMYHEAQLSRRFREFITGLTQHLSKFAHGPFAKVINAYNPELVLNRAIAQGKVVIFLLHSLSYPDKRAEDVGTMALMELQSVAAMRLRLGISPEMPTLVVIDEAQTVLTQPFLSMFDMARSAGFSILLSHQVRSQFSDAMIERIEQNTAIKIIMRIDEPDTREYYARMIGETLKEFVRVTEAGQSPVEGSGQILTPDWSEGYSQQYDFNLRPELFGQLKPGEAVVVTPHQVAVAKLPYVAPKMAQNPLELLPVRTKKGVRESQFTKELRRFIEEKNTRRQKKMLKEPAPEQQQQGEKTQPLHEKTPTSPKPQKAQKQLPQPQTQTAVDDMVATIEQILDGSKKKEKEDEDVKKKEGDDTDLLYELLGG